MLARCGRCQSTFVTDRFGAQGCPACGSPVFIRDPEATLEAEPSPSQAPERPPEPAAGLTPWERRRQLGFGRALWETVRLALAEPGRLFTPMRTDTAEGAVLYVALVSVLPVLVGLVWSYVSANPAEDREMLIQLRETFEPLMSEEQARQFTELARRTSPGLQTFGEFLAMALGRVLFWVGRLLAFAGLSHGVLWVAGKAPNGFLATFKGFAYAETPALLLLVPLCGSLVAPLWIGGLEIFALARTQKTSTAWATVAVVLPGLLLLCCGGFVAGMFALAPFGTPAP
jgi:hypothetical protein